MSGVRKLLHKANSAPPTSRLNLPNHGSTEEQWAALEAQKERTSQLEEKLNRFTVKVGKQKEDSKVERHRQNWIHEHQSLFKDRQAAQQELDEALSRTRASFSSPSSADPGCKEVASDAPFELAMAAIHQEFQNDVTACQDLASTLLTGVVSLRARVASLSGKRDRQQELHLHEALGHMRKFLDDEMNLLEVCSMESDSIFAKDGTGKMLKELSTMTSATASLMGDGAASECGVLSMTSTSTAAAASLDGIDQWVDDQVDVIRSRFPHASDDARVLFQAALVAVVERGRSDLRQIVPSKDMLDLTGVTSQEVEGVGLESGTEIPSTDADSAEVKGYSFTPRPPPSRLSSTAASSMVTSCPACVSEGDLERIRMLMKAYDPNRNKSMVGRTREELYDRIHHDIPHISVHDARRAVSYLQLTKAMRLQRMAVVSHTKAELKQLLSRLEDVCRAEEEHWAECQLQLQQERESEAARIVAKAELDVQRAEYAERKAAQEAADRASREAEQAAADARQRKLQAEYDTRLKELALHHQEKAEAEAQQKKIDEEIRQMTAAEDQRRAEYNQVRVDARKAAFERRMDDLRLQKLLADEAVASKEEALDRLYKKVEERMGVQRDPKRVVQSTVASQQTAGSGYVGAREATTVAFQGYTTDDIMRDPRFKIHQALVAANLHHSAYARQVLGSFQRVAPAMAVSAQNPFSNTQS